MSLSRIHFTVNHDLIRQARAALSGRDQLYWVVGGSGAGKSTICKALADQFAVPIYDMDAHVYGSYHARFTQERHPANNAWTESPNGLEWLLDMSWEEFKSFNQAALPEYLDLLVEDLRGTAPGEKLLVDGGICHPALVARAIPARQILCLAAPETTSRGVWEDDDERLTMRDYVYQLPNPEEAWHKFLDFDERITQTILEECIENAIPVCTRRTGEPVDEFAARAASLLGLQR